MVTRESQSAIALAGMSEFMRYGVVMVQATMLDHCLAQGLRLLFSQNPRHPLLNDLQIRSFTGEFGEELYYISEFASWTAYGFTHQRMAFPHLGLGCEDALGLNALGAAYLHHTLAGVDGDIWSDPEMLVICSTIKARAEHQVWLLDEYNRGLRQVEVPYNEAFKNRIKDGQPGYRYEPQ